MNKPNPKAWRWDQSDLNETLEFVYRITTEDDGVDKLIAHLAARWPDTRTAIFYHDLAQPRDDDLLNVTGNWLALDEYAEYYVKLNPWQPLRPDVGVDTAMRSDKDIISTEEIRKTEFYNDFLRRNSVDVGLPIHFSKGPNTQSTIGIHYDQHQISSDNEIDCLMRLMSAISPHLRRAFQLRARLATIGQVGPALMRYLDNALEAVFVVRNDGRIVMQNAAAEELLGIGGVAYVNRWGALSLTDVRADSIMSGRIRLSSSSFASDTAITEGFIPLPTSSGDYLVEVVPSRPILSHDLFVDAPMATAVVSVRAVFPDLRLKSADLRAAFDLTIAESQLAQGLLNGQDTAAHAHDRGISVHTARVHLRSIFSKLGVSRQQELVRILARMARRQQG